MTNIKYTGPSDFQAFGPGDFMKVGVETEENLVFINNRVYEIDDELAAILTGGEGVFAGFKFEETDEEAWVEPEPDEDVPEEIEGEEENTEGDPQVEDPNADPDPDAVDDNHNE